MSVVTKVCTEERIWQALKDVDDPEMPISLVDMGMVYAIQIQNHRVKIQLGPTSTACPALDFIREDIEQRLRQENIDEVEIEWVWDPPWTNDRISEEGKFILTTWGVSV